MNNPFFYMIIVPLIYVAMVLVVDLLEGFVGLAFSQTKRFHRLGVEMVGRSCMLCKYTPEVCALPCSCGVCKIWTCPHFHE